MSGEEPSVVPLESNPEVFSDFAHGLGLDKSYGFVDIYSLTDPDLMAFTPGPVVALILLFPLNDFFETSKDDAPANKESPYEPVWFRQSIKNACGLYALLHSLSNNSHLLQKESKLLQYLQLHPVASNRYADKPTDEFILSISKTNADRFQSGQSKAPDADEDVNLHFITFVEKDGKVYELDGRRSQGARLLGNASKSPDEGLLGEELVSNRVQWYMDKADEKNKLHFNLLGLAPSLD
ncbi:hypothetical protein ZYGR_0BA01060 [Zygosaccharomyces rouxii]|uniref:Ubiquitin carboxyl-terminal hydrolase n=1 Tax=Zygosaccharomyces rouxii TaxID=4956 RepID=A0A1Q3AKN7_ZYGRO|nr:hypothetical protein ZYGR_0BA01060 [Zygosaccharomyces rouxii]